MMEFASTDDAIKQILLPCEVYIYFLEQVLALDIFESLIGESNGCICKVCWRVLVKLVELGIAIFVSSV